jgi:histidinol-phosphate aminotransferase
MKKSNISKFIRQDISAMKPYVPGITITDLAKQFEQKYSEVIKLNSNENPYGPSPQAKQAVLNALFHYYPDSTHQKVRLAIAKHCGSDIDTIIVGSGSDEIIDLITRGILNEGDKVINCPPTFGMYEIYTVLNRGKIINIKRDNNFEINVEEIIKACDDEKVKIIFICNPNNPTGNVSDSRKIISLLRTGKLVIVDEAYFEFAKITMLPLMKKYDNLIILRSFSKWAGLAGLRIGYGIMSSDLVRELLKIKPPFNVNLVAEMAVLATLHNPTYANKSVEKIINERERMLKQLRNFPTLKVYPSLANFIFVQIMNKDYEILKELFDKNKIALRYFQSKRTKKSIRITIGKPKQNNMVLATFREALL